MSYPAISVLVQNYHPSAAAALTFNWQCPPWPDRGRPFISPYFFMSIVLFIFLQSEIPLMKTNSFFFPLCHFYLHTVVLASHANVCVQGDNRGKKPHTLMPHSLYVPVCVNVNILCCMCKKETLIMITSTCICATAPTHMTP